MYRIIKRIVHTVTTVTWLVRLEKRSAGEEFVEKEITFPAAHSLQADVLDELTVAEEAEPLSHPNLDERKNENEHS